MHISALPVLLPITIAWVGLLGTHAFAMRREARYRGFWGAVFWAFLPALLSGFWLTTERGFDMTVRNVVLGCLGGVVGAAAAVWFGYIIGDLRANAQSPSPPAETPLPGTAAPSVTAPGGINQYGPGQQFIAPGGTFYLTPTPPPPTNSQGDPAHIWQDGIIVGDVVGGRRDPADASKFLFAEISHTQQFNIQRTFHFMGQMLETVSVQSDVSMDSTRPQDGRVLTQVVAKIYDGPKPNP